MPNFAQTQSAPSPSGASTGMEEKTEQALFFALSSDLLCMLDGYGHIRLLNSAWGRLIDTPLNSLIGVSMLGLLHPNDRPDMAEALRLLADGKAEITLDNQFSASQGVYRRLRWRLTAHTAQNRILARADEITEPESTEVPPPFCSAEPSQNAGASVGGPMEIALALQAEIQERIRTERKLAEQRAFLRSVIDTAPLMIFVKDRQGRYTLSNQYHAAFLGTTVEEVLNRTSDDFSVLSPVTSQRHNDDQAVMDSLHLRHYPDKLLIDAQGARRWFDMIKQPLISEDGKSYQMLGVATDITERKRSQEELQRAELQLVQSAKLASLGTLAAGVAHELNQPLAVIRGIAQQLLEERGLPDCYSEDLKLIETQTHRMTKIINHLRTFCRASNGQIGMVDINRVARDCFILIGQQLKDADIAVEFALCPEPTEVRADANELEQVILNLVTNARDALEKRPDAKITLRSGCEAGRVVLEISDNGPGVPADLVSRIFDPFFTTKETGKGTGLGLSICHGILTRYSGSLEYRTAGGAVFTLSLPLVQEVEK